VLLRRLPVSTRPLLQVSAKSGAGVQELFVKAAVRAADAAKDRRAPAATAAAPVSLEAQERGAAGGLGRARSCMGGSCRG
jgi:hypothetical protein